MHEAREDPINTPAFKNVAVPDWLIISGSYSILTAGFVLPDTPKHRPGIRHMYLLVGRLPTLWVFALASLVSLPRLGRS